MEGNLLLIHLIRRVKLIHRVIDEVKDSSADNRMVGSKEGISRAKIYSFCAKDREEKSKYSLNAAESKMFLICCQKIEVIRNTCVQCTSTPLTTTSVN